MSEQLGERKRSELIVYHGGTEKVEFPICKFCRRNLDFGQGFYLTNIKEQAEACAAIIARWKGRNVKPVVSVFRFDEEHARLDGVRYKIFPSYDLDWLDFVVDCRRGKDYSSKYDVIEGGVANDNVIDTVEDYEKGIITAEQALGQLQYKKVNHQLCILSQSVIDHYLQVIESYSPNLEDEE